MSTESFDDGAGDGVAGESGTGDGIDLGITGSTEGEAEMGLEEIGVGGDVFDVILGVGRGEDFCIDDLAGGIEGESDIGGTGVAAKMIRLG